MLRIFIVKNKWQREKAVSLDDENMQTGIIVTDISKLRKMR